MDLNQAQATEPTVPATSGHGSNPAEPEKVSQPEPKDQPPATEAAKKEEMLSSRFAALSKKEKQSLRAAQLAKQERDALAKEKAELTDWKKQKEEARANALRNPLKYLEEAGLTYEQLTNSILAGDKITPELEIASVKKEIQRLREEQEQREAMTLKQQKEAAELETQETLSKYQVHLDQFLDQNKENYEFLHAFDVKSLVLPVIQTHYEETLKSGKPIILSEKEAAELVEKSMESVVDKLVQTKKFKSKYSKTEEPKKEAGDSGSSTKTLSNSLVSSSAPSLLPAKTEQDRMARALAAMQRNKVS